MGKCKVKKRKSSHKAKLPVQHIQRGETMATLNRKYSEAAIKAQYYKENEEVMRAYATQQSLDFAMIVLHEEFGFGAERNRRFENAFTKLREHFYLACEYEQLEVDEDGVYFLAKFDQALKQAGGPDIPYDDRYSTAQLSNHWHIDLSEQNVMEKKETI